MQRLELDVSVREGSGKGAARKLRSGGRVPAVLYGGGMDPVSLQIDRRELERVMHVGVNALIDLKGPAEVKGKLVLVKDLQRDPVKRNPIHCDLLAVDTKKKLHVSVPIHLTGKAKGVELGGVLEPVLREVEIICLPLVIPDSFELDVTELDIGDALHISDLQVPEGIEIPTDPTVTVVHVIVPRVEAEPEEEAEEEGAEAAPADGAAAPAAPAEGGESGDGD